MGLTADPPHAIADPSVPSLSAFVLSSTSCACMVVCACAHVHRRFPILISAYVSDFHFWFPFPFLISISRFSSRPYKVTQSILAVDNDEKLTSEYIQDLFVPYFSPQGSNKLCKRYNSRSTSSVVNQPCITTRHSVYGVFL